MLRMMFFASASLAAREPWSDIALLVDKEHQDKAQYLSPPVSGLGTLGHNADTPQTSAAQADALNWTPAESGLTQRQYDVLRDYTGALYWYLNKALRTQSITDPLFRALLVAHLRYDRFCHGQLLRLLSKDCLEAARVRLVELRKSM